jgi:hypothetical protein
MKIIEIHSIRRSGHHAFTNWLVNNLLDTDGSIGYCPYKFNNIQDGNLLWVNEAEYNLNQIKKTISEVRPNYLFLTYENFQYREDGENSSLIAKSNINSLFLTPYLEEEWGVTNTITFSFIREFWNNFASLFNLFPFYKEGKRIEEIKQWVSYYKILLKHNLQTSGGLFDSWIQNEEYANTITNQLIGIDNKLQPLNTAGTQSSFNKPKLTIEDLLSRKDQYTFPDWFLEIVYNDLELTNLLIQQQSLL